MHQVNRACKHVISVHTMQGWWMHLDARGLKSMLTIRFCNGLGNKSKWVILQEKTSHPGANCFTILYTRCVRRLHNIACSGACSMSARSCIPSASSCARLRGDLEQRRPCCSCPELKPHNVANVRRSESSNCYVPVVVPDVAPDSVCSEASCRYNLTRSRITCCS